MGLNGNPWKLTKSAVVNLSETIGITYSSTTPTNENVIVEFTNNNEQEGLRLEYQIGSTTGKWLDYTEPIEMTENGKVYARLFDVNGQSINTVTATVQNIDRVAPVIASAIASTSWGKTNSIALKATDSGTLGCAIGNIEIGAYGINQSSTTEPTYTIITPTTSLNTAINNIAVNGTYYVWVKDQAGNTANTAVTINKVDTTDPITADLTSSSVEVKEKAFILTATGTDGGSGIAKYEFYINNILENTVTKEEETATYKITAEAEKVNYTCKVRVYDNAGNYKDSNVITVKIPKVGDMVNYDAGKWNQSEDTSKITSSGGAVTWSSELPKNQGEFGGFTDGESRNSNSTSQSGYSPDYEGWKIWDIDYNIGEITLISAGQSETYYHDHGYGNESENILRNRNWSMYENEYAKSGSAKTLTKEELDRWYKKYIDSNVDDTYNLDKFPTSSEKTLIKLVETGSHFWLASVYDPDRLYYVNPYSHRVTYSGSWGRGYAYGIRVLVTLKSDIHVEETTSTKGITTWNIVGN